MQNRVALGSPSLQRADHAASSVASTVSVPPGHPGDSGLWWIPFESYPTKLSHTEPLIRWLWAGPAMLERAVLIMLLFVLLDLSSACADSTASPTTTIWGSKHPMSQGLFWWLVSQQAADLGSWNGPPQRPVSQARFRNVIAGTRGKKKQGDLTGLVGQWCLEAPLLIYPWALFFCSPNDSTHWKFSRSIWILEFQITALTSPWLHKEVAIARKLFNWATPHLCEALLLYGSQCLFN